MYSKQTISLVVLGLILVSVFALSVSNPRIDIGGLDFKNDAVLLGAVTIGALIDSANPCAISVLFITIGFLMSLGHTRKKILLVGGTYIAGLYLVYLLIGLGILQALTFFGITNFFARLFALILIFGGGIELGNLLVKDFPVKLKIPDFAKPLIARLLGSGSYPASFFAGVAVGLFEFPCTGGPYLVILGLLHTQGEFLKGIAYLLYYNLVFVLPLVVILILAKDMTFLNNLERRQGAARGKLNLALALGSIALGALLYFTIP